MSFNDEDLKRFRNPDEWLHICPEEGLALIALLEAATKVCEAVGSIECDPTEITGMEDTLEAFEAWRKAAGK